MQILDKEAHHSSLRRDVQAGLRMIIKKINLLKKLKRAFRYLEGDFWQGALW